MGKEKLTEQEIKFINRIPARMSGSKSMAIMSTLFLLLDLFRLYSDTQNGLTVSWDRSVFEVSIWGVYILLSVGSYKLFQKLVNVFNKLMDE